MIKEENGRNLSDLSKFLKKLRIDHSEFLGDMADKLEISAAHLSSVESGRKTVPADFADKITALYTFIQIILISPFHKIQSVISRRNCHNCLPHFLFLFKLHIDSI